MSIEPHRLDRDPGRTRGTDLRPGPRLHADRGRAITIDIASRLVIGEHDTGCGASHGFPQIDDGYGLVVAGCSASGGAAIVSNTGSALTG